MTRHAALIVPMLLAAGACAQVGVFTESPAFGEGGTICFAWADADLDGLADVAVGNYFGQANWLHLADAFEGHTEFGAGSTFALCWADVDNDGDPDMSVGNGANQANALYLNDGTGLFEGAPAFDGASTVAFAFADYDLDGDLDLAVGNGILGVSQQNRLYVNNGDGTFEGQDQFGMLKSDSVAWADVDNDGDPDLAVGNGGFSSPQQNKLYINNGDGTFTERDEFGEGDTSAIAFADADNDGDFDLAVMNWNAGQSALYLNDGAGNFSYQAAFGVGDPNTLAWGDVDNDGDLDLAQGNGDFGSAAQNRLYVNNGDATFAGEDQFGLGSTDSVTWADVDADGDLDLAAANEHTPTTNYLYTSDTPAGGRVVLHLRGRFHEMGAGYSNRDAVGAVVRVYEGGFLGDDAHLLGARQVEAQGGFAGQNAPGIHLGLGERAAVDVRVTWPGSGGTRIVQDVTGIGAGAVMTIEEGGCPADCDASGTLNILDFVCFQGEWQSQTPRGDCDGNGQYNILDFVCYQGAFVAGCP